MAYNKTVWVNDSTPAINATNLNNIENGIETLDNASTNMAGLITTNTNNITNLQARCTVSFTGEKTSLSGGVLTFDTINSTSDKLTLSNGGIRIGAGISKIMLSASVFFQFTAANQDYVYMAIRKNSTDVANSICAQPATYSFATLPFAPKLIDVAEGDTFYIVSLETKTGKYRGGGNSWMTIEVVK